MPKKTRQEKILAQLKRLQQVPTDNPVTTNSELSSEPKFIISNELKSLETKTNSSFSTPTAKIMDYTYAYKDLRKTLIFVALAVIFEIILSRVI